MKDKILKKVLKWVCFTVVVSCLPLIFTYVDAFVHSTGTPEISIITEHGELYLLSSALCATGVGEMFSSGGRAAKSKLLAGAAALFLVILCSYAYVDGSKNIAENKKEIAVNVQFFALLVSIVISTACIALSEF